MTKKINISEHLKKEYWRRRTVPEKAQFAPTMSLVNYITPTPMAGEYFKYLTQNDFMNEIEPEAHEINTKFYSKRPVWELVPKKDKDGNDIPNEKTWRIVRFDDMETVALGLQMMFALKKASYFAADGFWTANETTDHERYNKLCSWKDTVGLNTAYMEVVLSCFQTGDGAIYLYQRGNKIEYTVFSFLYGDILYPDLDEDRNPVLYREYSLKGKRAVDIYSTKTIETWVAVDTEEETAKPWIEKVKGWFGTRINDTGEISEDGFRLLSRKQTQLGEGINQCVYFRVNDIPSGCAQGSIESLERSCSYVAEEVKSTAFPALFLKATKFTNLPPLSAHGKTFGVKGTAEDVKNADAKFLAPPDASNIATLNISTQQDNIMHTTMSVFIEPEILKSGADSSTSIKIMFAPEIQWCQTMWPQFFHQVKELMDVFKALVGKIEEDGAGYDKLRISVGQNIWIPQNDSERIKNELDQVYARVKSRKAAMDDIGNNNVDDEKHIWDEWEKELEIKARIPAEEKAKVDKEYGVDTGQTSVTEGSNPNKPSVDNNADGKSILE